MSLSEKELASFRDGADRLLRAVGAYRVLEPELEDRCASHRTEADYLRLETLLPWVLPTIRDGLFVSIVVDVSRLCDRGRRNLTLERVFEHLAPTLSEGCRDLARSALQKALKFARGELKGLRDKVVVHEHRRIAAGLEPGPRIYPSEVLRAVDSIHDFRCWTDPEHAYLASIENRRAEFFRRAEDDLARLFAAFGESDREQ